MCTWAQCKLCNARCSRQYVLGWSLVDTGTISTYRRVHLILLKLTLVQVFPLLYTLIPLSPSIKELFPVLWSPTTQIFERGIFNSSMPRWRISLMAYTSLLGSLPRTLTPTSCFSLTVLVGLSREDVLSFNGEQLRSEGLFKSIGMWMREERRVAKR